MNTIYPYLSEFMGTFLLIFIGETATATILLNKRVHNFEVVFFKIFAWGLALGIPTMIFYRYSGAYFNPAVVIAFAITGSLKWKYVMGYITSEMLGAFFGACSVFIFYHDLFQRSKSKTKILEVFVTRPKKIDYISDTFAEMVGTFFLMSYSILIPSLVVSRGSNGVFASLFLVSITFSLGGINGLSMNPARDLGPRVAHTILPIKHKGNSEWNYALVPVIGSVIGATFGAIFSIFVLKHYIT